MVLCDIERIYAERQLIDIFRRKGKIREDDLVMPWIIHHPLPAPASALLRREVLSDVGDFDEALHTAEDMDLHLRVAHRWKIVSSGHATGTCHVWTRGPFKRINHL